MLECVTGTIPRAENNLTVKDDSMKARRGSDRGNKGNKRKGRSESDSVTLAEMSGEGVKKVLGRANARGLRGKKQDGGTRQVDSHDMLDKRADGKEKQALDDAGCSKDTDAFFGSEDDEMNDSDWEECPIPKLDTMASPSMDTIKELTIEFDDLPDPKKQKRAYRATAEDKELAELVHRVHLLCLLARGRIVDNACDDPLIQASLLSLLPSYLSNLSSMSKVTTKALGPLVRWFRGNFHVTSSPSSKKSFCSALAFALESREGSPEELAALSVALFRALKLTTRFVSILDVASIKPGTDKYDSPSLNGSKLNHGIFNTSTLMVAKEDEVSSLSVESFVPNEHNNVSEISAGDSSKRKDGCLRNSNVRSKSSFVSNGSGDKNVDSSASKSQNEVSEQATSSKPEGPKRRGDIEFEMQLAVALAATAVASPKLDPKSNEKDTNSSSSNIASPIKGIKRLVDSSISSEGISTALGSKKVGSPLYWAEVYCNGENLDGKWVHVDVVNGIVDAEQTVEAAAAACKTSLRYVVAFAGGGAKDVTRRYCTKWYKIAPKRVNSLWWDAVLAPLRLLESAATGGSVHLGKQKVDLGSQHKKDDALKKPDHPIGDGSSSHADIPVNIEASTSSSFLATRSALEDMELATRALTEPLPTNQQAYKNHELYALERWLKKNQILHPNGPILGFCSGHPVYPRTCVQTLRTKERWLREGLQVKANEPPAKVLKHSSKLKKVEGFEGDEDDGEGSARRTMELYGKWQLEPLCLPHAVNGIVPKNERGQVDVWSKKCLPPGTVHLRFPRIFWVAKRLGIDYAPAMVGFEYKSGRATPVFDGIVVCAEFRDAILEAYVEEQERKQAEEKRQNEAQAASRWYQLLSSILTRERLKNRYATGDKFTNVQVASTNENTKVDGGEKKQETPEHRRGPKRQRQREARGNKTHNNISSSIGQTENHEHVFLEEDQSFDEERSMRTKRCRCGFSVQVEEL